MLKHAACGQKQIERDTEMYFSFFLIWHTTKMTPKSRATIITTIMAGTSTMGSIPTTGILRASKAENTLLINCRLSRMLHTQVQWQVWQNRFLKQSGDHG